MRTAVILRLSAAINPPTVLYMEHRHLIHQGFTAAAIDDIIERGGRSDWVELRDAARSDPKIVQTILRVCAARQNDPYAQRHHLWRHYASRHAA